MSNLFEEYSEKEKKPDTAIDGIRKKAEELASLQSVADDMAEELAQVNGRINKIKQTELPELMSEIGLQKFKLDDGSEISIKEFVRGSIPKDEIEKNKAFDWLEANELGSIIKTEVVMNFAKGQDNLAKNAIAMLEENGYEPITGKTVHAQTLQATARELLREGKEVPLETLGLFAGKAAEFKSGKKK